MIMRNDVYENNWSPFDPKWYSEAFDQYVSTADQLFNQDLIIQQGFKIPDTDGSRSSIFRNEAVLNNSFNEQKLRETLKDIYLNSSHKLIASNHDNTHFYQWHGYISDMEFIPNTNICKFTIPTKTFINAKERDKYKISQYLNKWIKPEDILNNWEVFKWHCLLFIDQRVYSDYELYIDDHETTIRFKYYDHWVKSNYPVYIYKFDTNASCRIKISKELCTKHWNWKLPVSYIENKQILNSTNIIVAFNKISDSDIRTDDLTHVDVLGDNLEFLKIENGYIDLSRISNFNNIYINSESTQWLWMSIIVPKFLHEYPIMLPTDIIYRPYVADFRPVVISDNLGIRNTIVSNDDQYKQVYIDMNGKIADEHDGWKQMIRPIVLSDAFDNPFSEPYEYYISELKNLKDLTVIVADTIEDFRLYMLDNPTTEGILSLVDKLVNDVNNTHKAYNDLLKKRYIEFNKSYELEYKNFISIMNDIKVDGLYSEWFVTDTRNDDKKDLWTMISPQVNIPNDLCNKYEVAYTLQTIDNHGILWTDVNKFMDQHRFRRPIDELDFWTFEYDSTDKVWRPYHLNVTRYFPDVYLLSDPLQEIPKENRIFKTFFFYTDTMNILNSSEKIIHPTATWDKDLLEYEFDRGAIYRDIFMEKFYWMGVKSIYNNLTTTSTRWELIEYVIDNDSYERFNQLFLNTMDPYFKMGLATYLKSENYGFTFDDAINKLNESINNDFLGYKRITNFENYLNKTWNPSYFDYIAKISDAWDPGDKLIRRPRSSFDILRLIPILLNVQNNIQTEVNNVYEFLYWIIKRLKEKSYNLKVDNLETIQSKIEEMLTNISTVYKFTIDLDLDVYSIDDLNYIIEKLQYHIQITSELEELFSITNEDIQNNNVYQPKKEILKGISDKFISNIYECINLIISLNNTFDIERFMNSINNLYTYFEYNKYNPDDHSLLGYINKFNDPWSIKVKELRNKLFQSTSIMYGNFDSEKKYTSNEVLDLINQVSTVKNDLNALISIISEFWTTMNNPKDVVVVDKFEIVSEQLNHLISNLENYMSARNKLVKNTNEILINLDMMSQYNIADDEKSIYDSITNTINNLILSLSYVVGKNNLEEALDNFNKLKAHIIDWNYIIAIEEEIFTKLLKFTNTPVEFINNLHKDESILNSICEYMDTNNIQYIPDTKWPTYSDVYSVDHIEISSGGFNNNIDEIAIVPHLGSYKITQISDIGGIVELLEDTGYRNTVYRDPMIQSNVYDAITNGIGMGITIKPLHSNRIPIINDEVINRFVIKIQNISHIVSSNLTQPNPYYNSYFSNILNDISSISSEWDDIVKIYDDNMSENAKNKINELINILISLNDPCEEFIEVRKNVDLSGLINDINSLITSCYDVANTNNLLNDNYYYYEDRVIVALTNLKDFYGNGTTWDNSSELKVLLDNSRYPLRVFSNRVIESLNNEELVESCNKILNKIDIIESTINKLPILLIDINPIIRNIDNKISNISNDDIQKDIWYRINSIKVALEGSGYKQGDIISIIPQLPTDPSGNPIHDMEDIIMNDVILLKIKEVRNDRVVTVEPIMDYAIPYSIWGIRETKTIVGSGTGLTVDVYSYQIQLSDTTLFNDKNSDVPILPKYNENDLILFEFENIHDLNIQYDIFYSGKQIINYIQRHVTTNKDILYPTGIDRIYLNANEVNNLKNSSLSIPAEHYFVYKLDNVVVKDPGAGYSVGQNVFVDLENTIVKLKVETLTNDPYKGIESLELSDVRINIDAPNPGSKNANVITDPLNNIDDEYNVGYYDKLTQEGIVKAATKSFDVETYPFISRRFDSLEDGDRNKSFMYPDVDLPLSDNVATNGDPDHHFYLGSRIDENHRWNGIMNTISPIDPFITDDKRVPDGKPLKGEYQEIAHQLIHNSIELDTKNAAMIEGDFVVTKFSQLPRHLNDWPAAKIGKCVIVENDETNNGHRMLYRLRTFVAAGFFVYDIPEIADYKWNHFEVNWMNCDYYPDFPSDKARFPNAPWDTAKTFLDVQREMTDNQHLDKYPVEKYNNTTYIHNLTLDDISVWNCTTHEWEDLHDKLKWNLEIISDNDIQTGFILYYLQEGTYSYDMKLFLNKIPDNQLRNAELKRNAILDVSSSIVTEVDKPKINTNINTGRHLRIRKLFPYEQKETFIIGKHSDGTIDYTMNFKLNQYMHFKNELHLEDIKIYNKSADRFENVLDPKMFEVQFKDDKVIDTTYDTQSRIIQSIIIYSGYGFTDGEVWAYNDEYGISVFGNVTTNTDGNILTFIPIHTINIPTESINLEFQVYQRDTQDRRQMGIISIEFNTNKVQIIGDGYIHRVQNPYAPLPKEFRIICQYNLDEEYEYEVIISKTSKQWTFIEDKWMVCPTFHIPDYNIQQNRVYILTNKGRFPLRNPSSGKPTMKVTQTETGTDVTFLNLYKRYEHLEIKTTPYPMRSVYVQRKIPSSGFIDLKGKLNKPLNKKYFEFWVNGKLLYDEVTIITPTKLFLHGLKSLKNLEIIEINRDPNEYFSDTFLEVNNSNLDRPYHYWNYETYLDHALEGELLEDNYTPEEQEYLLSPVWRQVEKDHPEFKNFPPNVDIEDDILIRVDEEDYPINDLDDPVYQFLIINAPTIEGHPIVDKNITFESLGFAPMTDSMIINILNEEWKDEINSDPYFPEHSIMTDDEWYGLTSRLYDEYGIRVHTLNESVYHVTDNNLLRINTDNNLSRIVKNKISYDLN